MSKDLKAAKQKVIEAVNTASGLYSVRPNAFLMRVFFDAKPMRLYHFVLVDLQFRFLIL
jgi:hypothetical protein